MTRAPDVQRSTFADLSDAVGELRRRGLRLSASRRRVLAALFAADGPCSAEHAHAHSHGDHVHAHPHDDGRGHEHDG